MRIEKSNRGFEFLIHQSYANVPKDIRLASQSSAMGEYEDAYERPGSSYLWIGEGENRGSLHHLSREEVGELIKRLQNWLDTGMLSFPEERK